MKDSFGLRLKFFRSKAGLSQQQLADKSGLSRKIISDYEVKLDVMPRETNLYKIADALGIDSSNLVPKSTDETAFKETEDGFEYKININELPRDIVSKLRKVAETKNKSVNEIFDLLLKKAITNAFESYEKGGVDEPPSDQKLTTIDEKEEAFIQYLKKAP